MKEWREGRYVPSWYCKARHGRAALTYLLLQESLCPGDASDSTGNAWRCIGKTIDWCTGNTNDSSGDVPVMHSKVGWRQSVDVHGTPTDSSSNTQQCKVM